MSEIKTRVLYATLLSCYGLLWPTTSSLAMEELTLVPDQSQSTIQMRAFLTSTKRIGLRFFVRGDIAPRSLDPVLVLSTLRQSGLDVRDCKKDPVDGILSISAVSPTECKSNYARVAIAFFKPSETKEKMSCKYATSTYCGQFCVKDSVYQLVSTFVYDWQQVNDMEGQTIRGTDH